MNIMFMIVILAVFALGIYFGRDFQKFSEKEKNQWKTKSESEDSKKQ